MLRSTLDPPNNPNNHYWYFWSVIFAKKYKTILIQNQFLILAYKCDFFNNEDHFCYIAVNLMSNTVFCKFGGKNPIKAQNVFENYHKQKSNLLICQKWDA